MSDSITIFVDSEDAGQNIVESLVVVPKEYWGKELQKISSSTAPLKEKISAMQADARSLALNARLFEPRSVTQLPIPEEERMFGLPFSIHGANNDLSIGSPAMGLCRIDNDWVYASTIDSPLPTKFANGDVNSDLWKAVWGDNQHKNFNDIAVLDVENSHSPFGSTEFFKLVPEELKEIDSYVLHQLDIEGTSQDFSLIKAATATTFDSKRPLYQYDHVLFVLTGVFSSSNPRIPAIKTGSGFKQGGRVTIILGTDREPCYVLGCGGAPGEDGGVGLEINDSNARFEVFRGNSASILAGGGGGGPAFECSSKENKLALTVIGGGGAIMGRSERLSLDPKQKTTKASYFSNKNIRRANPPKIKPQGGIIKSIKNIGGSAEVEILDSYHELYNQDKVYITDTGDADAKSYYVKSTGPREFELYEDLKLTSPYSVDEEYSTSSRTVSEISRVDIEYGLSGAMLVQFSEPLPGEIGDSYETTIEDCSISSYNKDVAIELVDGLGNQAVNGEGWIIPSISGGKIANDGTAYFPTYTGGGRWGFIGREGVLEPTTHSIPGYKDITVSGNGGWFGESGQFTIVDKIYDQGSSESSAVVQFGGAPGDAIQSQTTIVSGVDATKLGELIEHSPWILGKGRAVAKVASEQESKLFFQTEDFRHDGIQEEEITSEARSESRNAGAIHIGGATAMVDPSTAGNWKVTGVKTEGILSNS